MPSRTLLFGLTLSLSLLAACGDKEGEDTSGDGGGTSDGGADGGGTGDGGTGDGGGDGGTETDADEDGWSVEAGDCDDGDASINPDASELDDDIVDNDCDGFIDEGTWSFGDLVITEVMNNPEAVADPDGEWIEVLNQGLDTLYLNGLTLRSEGEDDHVISSSIPLPVEPGEYAVVASNSDARSNGGVNALYGWTNISLSNESDTIAIYAGSTLLDDLEWDDGASMPDPNGASMNLDDLYLGASLNDVPNGWCASYDQWASGSDYGSPGAINVLCGTTDRDGDGYSLDTGDCDERDPAINPDAEEIWYDGVDQNCDEWSDYDADYDGEDAIAWGGDDCDDTRSDVNPDADEVCDEDDTDENCNGLVDDDDPGVVDQSTLYPDADGDGYGSTGSSVLTCESPDGYGTGSSDCDDSDEAINPGATETWYDGVDQNCDGANDFDADADGYRSADHGGDDCDDELASVNPDQVEVCDDADTDEDCNGLADDADPGVIDALTYYPDVDGDGYGSDADSFISCEALDGWESAGGDCDDDDRTVNPGATEVWYDGDDQDCDGWNDYDADHDGFASDLYGGEDCDDEDQTVFPYAYEDMSDGLDNDCDGYADTDDPDTVTTLRLSDDSASLITFSAMTFPLCGTDRSSAYVISNGRVIFGSSSTSYSESASTFIREGYASVAAWWDDLNPASGGTVTWIEHEDAIAVHFRDVYEYGTTSTNTFTYILRDDGRIVLAYGEMNAADGLVGWTCGTGRDPSAVDLTEELTAIPEGSLGIGAGTEDAVYEYFSGSGVGIGDVSDQIFHFCVNSGTDGDGDGWTDECGDPDDSDPGVTP